MQWGYANDGVQTQQTYYPIAFSNNNYNLQVTPYFDTDATGFTWRTFAATTTGVRVTGTKTVGCYWMAIGW